MKVLKVCSSGSPMLEELRVTNLGILEEGQLDPAEGLTVLTGETGTGKTLMLGAIELLMGKPFARSRIGPFADTSRVEARFTTGDAEYVVTKSLTQGGRTKTRLNGGLAAVAEVGEIIGEIVDVVAQHDHLSLGRSSRVREMIDNRLSGSGRSALKRYSATWAEWEALQEKLLLLGGDVRALERERELLAYQADEIANASLNPGEDTTASVTADRLRNAEELALLFGEADETVVQMSDLVGVLQDPVRRAQLLAPDIEMLAKDVEGFVAQISELRTDVRGAREGVIHDPEQLSLLESRLMVLSDLRRKYGETVDDVILFGHDAAARGDQLADSLAEAATIDAARLQLSERLAADGKQLAQERVKAAKGLCSDAESHLKDLGFTTPKLEVRFSERTPARHGITTPVLYFASDERLDRGPVAQVASGGELSRLVLALYLSSGNAGVAVVAFDEIDAGVGGATALALGRKLRQLAADQQVLCVTHLPQIAAFADKHYCVRRNELGAIAVEVTQDARLGELTRMLSGLEDSEDGRKHAQELLEVADS
jgi:DNA repair protein RecN (Recombination protein N)